ncbi:MAG: phage integrase SAM-like domain-containing protein [Vicingaceae bacterium]|nr:MAG: phage integrase SAM-like domain-containing protein [Vicingaceae bacterium]
MATINFYIQTQHNPAGIYVRLRDGRKIDAKAKTNYVVNPKNWSIKKGQPVNLKDENQKVLNQHLLNFRHKLLNHFNMSVDKCPIDSAWLKEFINPTQKIDSITNKLVDYFDYYIVHKRTSIKRVSLIKYHVIKKLIKKLQIAYNKDFFIKDVNADFKLELEDFCKHEGYSQNTISRILKFVKTVCYHAASNGIETHFQLKNLYIRAEKIEKIYLTKEEINLINNTTMPAEHLDNARDWLIISCLTGQRISDFMNFFHEMIRYDTVSINKKNIKVPFIDFTQEKTKKKVTIVLDKTVMKILKKRNGKFPRKISHQHYNEYIKEVCKIAGLDQMISGSKINKETNRKEKGVFPKYTLVSSHIGRRSYASNYYGIIPTSLLINQTGHSSEKMFLEYIGKSEPDKARHLATYFY